MSANPAPPLFAQRSLDRAAHLRDESGYTSRAVKAKGAALLLFAHGRLLVANGQPLLANPAALPEKSHPHMIFLGLDEKQQPWLALDFAAAGLGQLARDIAGGGQFKELRALAMQGQISPPMLSRIAQARALMAWHQSHLFCSACGEKSKPASCGYKRHCPACGQDHFPRTDPVVIMLAEHEDKVFLARQSGFPPGMVSAPAGFVEPGESLEEAVKRELWEEAQIEVGAVVYHATQPWPFPYSLMIGCFAHTERDDFTLPQGGELEEGGWFSRNQISAMLQGEGVQGFFLPPPMAIAHHLARAFIERG